jgi:tripartite-type tricarboxylate transporter receptor subunit TctC
MLIRPSGFSLRRRGLLAAGLGAGLPLPGLAQPRFPDRPIKLYVPFPAGGTTDVQMRALAEAAGRRFGQPIIIENRGGAGGTLGAQALLHDRPDGHTIGAMPVTTIRYPVMQSRPGWNPLTDFTWIILCTGYLFGVVVRADAPWRSFPEFLADAKARPGVINYGTPGVGGSLHLTMEEIAQRRGIDWVHVPFRGLAENIQALLGGQIHATTDSSGWAELVNSGRVRLLVTWGAERARRFPDVPTLRECGIDIVTTSPYGLAGPRGIDPAVVTALHDTFKDALQDPQHLAVLDRMDMSVVYMNGTDYLAEVRRTMEVEGALARRLGIRIN